MYAYRCMHVVKSARPVVPMKMRGLTFKVKIVNLRIYMGTMGHALYTTYEYLLGSISMVALALLNISYIIYDISIQSKIMVFYFKYVKWEST